ncbi:MAG: ribonuclease HI [Chloroflexi bacterium]|nr:ribonuclease HI [Chloroflexota bacterium]
MPGLMPEKPETEVQIYTDGGCDPNPGPGGWAAIVRHQEREWVLTGNEAATTNNRMELMAAAAALAVLDGLLGRCRVDLYTDSQYVRQGLTEWLPGWVERGWMTSSREPVRNQDLWRALDRLSQAHDVTWHWLKGHAGHPDNERADRLATEARQSRVQAMRARARAVKPSSAARADVQVCIKVSALGAEGWAGWGAVLRSGDAVREMSGSVSNATGNAVLIRAATEVLRALTRSCRVVIYSDASYLIQGASSWAPVWRARGWHTKDGKAVANRSEWEALLAATQVHQVTWAMAADGAPEEDLVRAGELASLALQSLSS